MYRCVHYIIVSTETFANLLHLQPNGACQFLGLKKLTANVLIIFTNRSNVSILKKWCDPTNFVKNCVAANQKDRPAQLNNKLRGHQNFMCAYT